MEKLTFGSVLDLYRANILARLGEKTSWGRNDLKEMLAEELITTLNRLEAHLLDLIVPDK